MTKKILITDPLSVAGKDVLEAAGLEVIELLDQKDVRLNEILPEVEGWIIRSGTTIGAAEMSRAKALKAIGRAGVGVDNIDIAAATAHGVVVMNTPGGNTISAAEHTIALMMSLARNIPAGDSSMKAKRWDRKNLVGTELNGKTLGLIGLGRIGQEVAKRALGLQMQVIGYDPYVAQDQLVVKDIEVHDLQKVLMDADVISLHLPRTEDTVNLIDTPELTRMKSSAMLINCARGGLVNEEALAAALASKLISGAAVDVYTQEPATENALVEADNIVLTPHLGASTTEAGENVAIQVATQMRDYLLDDRLSNTINLPISDMSILKTIGDTLALATTLGRLQHPLHFAGITAIRVSYNGDQDHIAPLLYSAFEGIMADRYDGTINLINAHSVADTRGIVLSTLVDPKLSQVQNVVAVKVESADGADWELSGYVDQQGGKRLIRVNDYHIDVLLDGPLLMVLNIDVPGVVGEVGTLLGNNQVNIAEYSLSRIEGDLALSLIKCDSAPSEDILDKLKSISSIKTCYFLG